MKPYTQIKNGKSIIREFNAETISPHELVWHRDKRDRKVEILSGKGWKFQIDNELPVDLSVGDTIYIHKEVFHRIIKGVDTLKIKIVEI